MKKNIFLVMLLIACTVSSVMAESGTIYYDYTSSDSINVIYSGGHAGNTANLDRFSTDDITQYESISTIVSGVYGFTTMPDDTYDTQFTLKIGSDTVASGTYYIWRSRIDGKLTGHNILTFIFDSYDVSGYTGAQTLKLDIGSMYMPIADITSTPTSITPSEGFFKLHAPRQEPSYALQKTTIYRSVDFHQNMVYDLTDGVLELTMTKNGYTNNINITDITTGTSYTQSSADDFHYVYPNIEQVLIEVENPITNNIWSDTIPETSTSDPSPSDPAEFTAYIYDAQTGNLISWSCLNKTYSGEYALPSSTYDPDGVIQAVAYWDETDWALFTASATGYKPDTTEFNYTAATAPPGSSTQMIFHLVPDGSIGNGSYALSFKVSQEISPSSDLWTRSVDATVICDGEQHLTGPTGTTWFNVSAGDHPYTVAKNGFETVQGTVTVSGNMLQSVYLNLGPDTPTVDDPTGNESGEVGDEDMHTAVAEAYAQFGAFIPEAVMIACVLFLLSMFKKF